MVLNEECLLKQTGQLHNVIQSGWLMWNTMVWRCYGVCDNDPEGVISLIYVWLVWLSSWLCLHKGFIHLAVSQTYWTVYYKEVKVVMLQKVYYASLLNLWLYFFGGGKVIGLKKQLRHFMKCLLLCSTEEMSLTFLKQSLKCWGEFPLFLFYTVI